MSPILLTGLLLTLGSLAGKYAQRLRLPQVVGYLVTGILCGPAGAGLLAPERVGNTSVLTNGALAFICFVVGGVMRRDTVRAYRRQWLAICAWSAALTCALVAAGVFAVTYARTGALAPSLSLAALLAAIATSTAPASITVLKERRAGGPLTSTVYAIIALDDGVSLALYAAAAAFVAALAGGSAQAAGRVLELLRVVGLSCVCGAASALLFRLAVHGVKDDDGRVLSLAIGSVIVCCGLAEALGVNSILAGLVMGAAAANFAPPNARHVFALIDRFMPPVYTLFFVLVGSQIDPRGITIDTPLLLVVYLAGRTAGKVLGSRVGAAVSGAPPQVRRYLPFCLLNQAGVAMGLAAQAARDYPALGHAALLVISANVFVLQLVGPVGVNHAVTKAGEGGGGEGGDEHAA